MKVFCADCKYHRFIATCKHPSTKHEDDYWARKDTGWGYGPRINANNDCKMYERLWWKFWLNKELKVL